MVWKGDSRRHSLARKGIKTVNKPMQSNGRKKKIPKVYYDLDREQSMKIVEWHNQYYTKSGTLAHDPSLNWDSPLIEIYGSGFLNHEQLMEIKEKYPDAMLSVKGYSKSRGGVSRRKLKIENLIIPHNDPLLLQIHIGTKVEMEHTDDPIIARQIALDHIEENHDYYTILLKEFPDEHPELLKELIKEREKAKSGVVV